MKKIKNIAIAIAVIAVIGYGSYFFFIRPTGFTEKGAVVSSFFENIDSEELCEKHFAEETQQLCEGYQLLFEERNVEIVDIVEGTNYLVVELTINETPITYHVSFVEVPITGIRGLFIDHYYLIDEII